MDEDDADEGGDSKGDDAKDLEVLRCALDESWRSSDGVGSSSDGRVARTMDEDKAAWMRLSSSSLWELGPKRPCATGDGGQGHLSLVSIGVSSIRSTTFGCEEGTGEDSFTCDGPCLKPVEAKGLGTIDGHCVVKADTIITARVAPSVFGPVMSGVATPVVVPLLGRGVTRLITPL